MIQKILHAALFTPSPEGAWGLPMFLWGRAGSGKTAMIREMASKSQLHMERLSPAERGEGQFGVIGVPSEDRAYLDYPAPRFVEKFRNGGLLFLDEINTAPPALQAPLLGAVQLRTIGASYLGDRTRVLAAANEPRDGTGTWTLGPSLRNRFGHLQYDGLDPASWVTGLLTGFRSQSGSSETTTAVQEEARVSAEWPAALAVAQSLVAGYVGAFGIAALDAAPPAGSAAKAWPSRRTVEYAVRALAASQVHSLTEDESNEFMSSFVGSAWVSQFLAWRASADLPNIADFLDGRASWKHNPARADRTAALLIACAAKVIPESAPNRIPRASALWAAIDDVMTTTPDCVMAAARALAVAGLDHKQVPAARFAMGRLEGFMRAAGAL